MGWETDVIHQISDEQQLLGPARAEITVYNEPEHSPYGLKILVSLKDGRYAVTRLEIIADRSNDAPDILRAMREPSRDDTYTPSENVPPVTAAGLLDVKLPPILRKALRPQIVARRKLSTGEWSTGFTEDDLVPATYLLAQLVGEHPTAAVAQELGITRQAAAQRVSRARKQGQLPPTTKGAR